MKTKIYFVCPNNNFASGGVKQIYRQVEILNKNNIEAYVLHKKIGKKDNWFSSNAPIKYSPLLFKKLKYILNGNKIGIKEKITLFFLKKISEKIEPNSILVFPEIYGNKINEIDPNIPKVVFNQNCFYTFNQFDNTDSNPYSHPNTLATIVVSANSQQYLKHAFPDINIFRIFLGINDKIFQYSDKKKKQICYMPRKLRDDTQQVIHILKHRKKLKEWKFIEIDNKTELEVAQIMQESAIFLSFSHKEGFGLPPAEAMACGCYTIGYHGEGGKEFFHPEFSTTINHGNVIHFAKKIEETAYIYEKNPEEISQRGKFASEFILNHYSLNNEEYHILNTWKSILKTI